MAGEINAYMLKKDELEYEVTVRGEIPASSVKELRAQVSILLKESTQIKLPDGFDYPGELTIVRSKTDSLLNKLATPSESANKSQVERLRSLAFHLHYRATRIIKDLVDSDLLGRVREDLGLAMTKLKTTVSTVDSDSSEEGELEPEVETARKHCYHHVTYVHPTSINSLNIKYNGQTCVLTFLGRLDELVRSRSLKYKKVFRSAAELFSDSALLWYRGVSASVDSWEDLKQELLDEFLPPDFDYRLMEELKARTQGAGEPFSTYYSVMLNFFSRLRTPVTDAEKLRILRRNIRPDFAERLVLIQIDSLSDFKAKCKELERQRISTKYFVEPPKANQQTLAADLAFSVAKIPNVAAAVTLPPQTSSAGQAGANLFCLRCRINGHSLRNCTVEKYLVCFRCGLKGYKVANCPKCVKTKSAVKVNTGNNLSYTCTECQNKNSANVQTSKN